MRIRTLLALLTTALLALPTVASAMTITFSMPEIVFQNLGNCGTDPIEGACNGSPPTPAVGSFTDWGGATVYFDAVRAGAVSPFSSDVGLGPLSFSQGFDFAVGSTGGGSAGTEPFVGCEGATYAGVTYGVNLDRWMKINGSDYLFDQSGTLNVNWCKDTLTIAPASKSFLIDGQGTIIMVSMDGAPALSLSGEEDDWVDYFDIRGEISLVPPVALVPVPSTLALLGLGLVGMATRRRRHS